MGLGSLIFKKKKKYLTLYFDVGGMESGAIFDFPKDRGDKRKTEMMQEILQAKAQSPNEEAQPATFQPQIVQKEVVREVVMIPCSYCGALVPQTTVSCPNCKAPRK